jgi:subtilisin family serine protease
MRGIISALVLIPTISFALPVKKGEQFRVQIPGEYIVTVSEKSDKFTFERKLGKNLYLVNSKNLKSIKSLKSAVPNYAYYGEYKEGNSVPNDVSFNVQYHHQMIKTTKAWEVTKGSEDIIIAVTDNEFQLDHEDLKNSWWVNPNEIPGNGIDDDNNGYIDDIKGWDFISIDNNVDSTTQPTHGTHVSGIIAAAAGNGLGGVGIAPNVKVMPLRWYGNERPWTSAIVAETYNYAVDNGAKIITTSYGIDTFTDDQAYLGAVKYARDNNVLVFNSAGNANTKNPPRQSIENVILVCSVKSSNDGKEDKKSSFSNYGTGIDICAPGDPIYAPVQSVSGSQNMYGNLQGTSMAAPAAAAVAALIWSAHPNFTDEEVLQRLYDSADEIDSKNFWYRGKLGHGRINAFKAVK